MPFAMYSSNAICKESANTQAQNPNSDLSYLDAIARFDQLWQSTTLVRGAEQNEKEMQRLIALIERFEADQTNCTQHAIREDNRSSRSFRFTEPKPILQGES
jgi:hypothetical protein